LIKNKKKLKVESRILLLYRTKVGINFINKFTKTFPKLLNVLTYCSIFFGYIAMAGAIYLIIQSVISIITMPVALKVPPITPLLPYLPGAFKLPLPPFYFTYWILIIVIIAVTHEFSHGIFAKHNKIKIKATGFGFLGPFLAAFVEPDEKAMRKKTAKAQLSILAAGSFANFIVAVLALLLLQAYFLGFYEKAGVTGYMLVASYVNSSDIVSIDNYQVSEFLNLSEKQINSLNKTLEIKTFNGTRYYLPENLYYQISSLKQGTSQIILYDDTPAFRAGLSGAIQKIGDYKIITPKEAEAAIEKYKPNDEIQIITLQKENNKYIEKTFTITLDKNPRNNSKPYLGIGFTESKGIISFLSTVSSPFFSPHTYAKPKINIELILFFQDLFFWLIIIAISVALLNMLPLGILDGGRFILITLIAITKSKKTAIKIYKIITFLIFLMFLAMMFFWAIRLL